MIDGTRQSFTKAKQFEREEKVIDNQHEAKCIQLNKKLDATENNVALYISLMFAFCH